MAGSIRQWVWYECSGEAALDADASGCRADLVNDGSSAGLSGWTRLRILREGCIIGSGFVMGLLMTAL